MSGPQCCSNPPTLNPSAGAGYVEPLGGLSSYVSGHPDSKLAIILISDVFGYEAPNLRKLADKVAAAGFYVVVPDFFHGDPFVYENADRPLPVWLKDHGTDKGFEDAMPVIEAVKNKGISGVGAAGFCWGAKVVVELAKSELIQAAVLLHPSFVTVDDIKGVKVPTAVLGAEIDKYSPIELLKQFEEVLAAKSEIPSAMGQKFELVHKNFVHAKVALGKALELRLSSPYQILQVDGYVKIFPKVSHGWTVRYDVEDEAAVKSAEESHQNLLEWFDKHVKRVGNVKLERRLSSGL